MLAIIGLPLAIVILFLVSNSMIKSNPENQVPTTQVVESTSIGNTPNPSPVVISPLPPTPTQFTASPKKVVNQFTPTSPSIQPTFQAVVTGHPTNSPSNPTPNPEPAAPIQPTPSVTSTKLNSISASSGKVGDPITMSGEGFGKSSFYYPNPKDFKGMVSFYGPSGQNSGGAPPAEQWAGWWSDNQIKVKVPGVKPGVTYNVEVTSSEGIKSNRVSFTVTE